MQPIEKKQRKSIPHLRLWLLLGCAAALAGVSTAVILLNQKEAYVPSGNVSTYQELVTKEEAEVASVTVTLRSGETWTLTRNANGDMAMADEPSFALDSTMVTNVMDAARIVSWEDTLSEDPAEYEDRLSEFGLDEPRCVATFTYTDDTSATIRIGSRSDDLDSSFYYMLVDGHPGLYALDLSTAQALTVEKQLLHAVTQPEIHKVRIDSISIQKGDALLCWQLDGAITDADAEDRWMLTSPTLYPAEGETMTNMRTNLSNLRVGSYIAEATPENLTAYGFDEPRMVLTVHMAAGTVGLTDDDGVYTPTDYPEGTVTLTVGGEKSDVVDYVLFEGCIYTAAHYSLSVFMDAKAEDTVTRYPLRVTLSNLSTLRVEKDGAELVWQVTREAVTDENGDIQYDDDGNAEYTSTVTRNGEAFSWDAFETAYDQLLITTVSGTLPEGWSATEEPHTVLTFSTVTGTEHTLALTRFDALHDAVICDGGCLFYLIHGQQGWETLVAMD